MIYGYLSADTSAKYVTYEFSNSTAYEKMKTAIINEFTNDSSQYSAKETILVNNGVMKLTPASNKIEVLDLVINEMTSLDMSNCNLSQADFQMIAKASSDKYPKLTKLNFSGNHIYNVNSTIMAYFSARKTRNFKNQTFSATSDADGTRVYPNIFKQAKSSNSAFYSSSGFTFTGCTENSAGTGIILSANTAKVTIKSENAEGTVMTIKKVAAPKVTITANKESPTNANTITYTFTWSEAVTGFAAEDVTVTNGTKGTFSGSGKKYTLVVTNSGSCTQTINVPAGKCTDAVGNGNTAASITRTIKRDEPTYKKGDVNGDGTVDLSDVLKIRRHIANEKKTTKITTWELTSDEKTRADINGNGTIDLSDNLLLRRYIAASKSETVKKNHPDWYWNN